MPIYRLRISPAEIIRLIRAEAAASGGQPEFYVSAYHDYVIEEDYDRAAYGVGGDARRDLVTAEAVLSVEPRLEQNYWVLSIVVRQELGPQAIDDENALLGVPLTVDAFRARFLTPDAGKVSVRLAVRTPQARAHFDRWWAELNARHAPGASPARADPARETAAAAPAATKPAPGGVAADDGPAAQEDRPTSDPWTYRSREAVGVFPDADALEAAVDQLEISGFDRARISVLGTAGARAGAVGGFYRSVAEIEDSANAPRAAFVSRGSRLEGEAAAVAVPFYLGGLAGAAAVAASGGALAVAIAATILGSAAGAGLGGLVAHAVARRHAERIAEQLAEGGLVLWVGVPSEAAEAQALAALRQAGARDVHVHEIRRRWGPADRPLSEAWVDPFLHHDPPV
ncbi:MAG: hypothetical protein KGL52_18170 [Rhodospirillales bacterium]|nr:hypothetical protein [Rhodospirillales bacterium]